MITDFTHFYSRSAITALMADLIELLLSLCKRSRSLLQKTPERFFQQRPVFYFNYNTFPDWLITWSFLEMRDVAG